MDKRIEAFLNSELSDEEVRLLEQQLLADRRLAEELAFYLSVKKQAALTRDLALEKRHREWIGPKKKTRTSPLKKWGWQAAAAVLVFAMGVSWLIRISADPDLEELSAHYVNRHFQTMSVHMSGSDTDSLQIAVNSFNAGNPAQTLAICERVLEREPGNAEARKMGGIAALRLQKYEKAISLFRSLGDDTALYSNPGRFYEAVTRLQQGGEQNEKIARKLLDEVVEKGLEGKTEAEKWRKK